MDSVEDSLKMAQQFHDSVSSSLLNDDYGSTNSNKYSSYFRLYEYQIVEMQTSRADLQTLEMYPFYNNYNIDFIEIDKR